MRRTDWVDIPAEIIYYVVVIYLDIPSLLIFARFTTKTLRALLDTKRVHALIESRLPPACPIATYLPRLGHCQPPVLRWPRKNMITQQINYGIPIPWCNRSCSGLSLKEMWVPKDALGHLRIRRVGVNTHSPDRTEGHDSVLDSYSTAIYLS